MNANNEDAPDECPICSNALEIDGTCNEHGGPSDWRKRAQEDRAESIRAKYLNDDDDK